MAVCPVVPCDVMPAAVEQTGLGCWAGMVAVWVADLRSPARTGLGEDVRTALVAAGAGPIRPGDVVVFCKPVVTGPGGGPPRRAGAGRWASRRPRPPRVAEDMMDALTGTPGVIDEVARSVTRQISGGLNRPSDIDARIRHDIAHPHHRLDPSPRHAIEVDYHAFPRDLMSEFVAVDPASGACIKQTKHGMPSSAGNCSAEPAPNRALQ